MAATMTPRRRVLRAIRRQPTDCIPAAPFMYDLAAVAAGIPVVEYCTWADAMAQAQLTLHGLVGQDVICVGSDNYYIAEGFGCRTTRCDDELPALETPAVESLAEVYRLRVPDPLSQGRMPVMIDAIRQVRQAVGDRVAIRCPGTGPFALASYFVGTQQWLLEIGLADTGLEEERLPAIHHALELASDALIAFGVACWQAGADIIQCGDSLASCDVISPRTYQRFAMPYQHKVFRAWRQSGITGSLLHICGDSTRVLPQYRDTQPDVIEIDNKVDLGFAKRAVGDEVALLGNVPTVTELLQGTPESVRAASQRCIQLAGDTGFLLGSGCLVPRRTPLENVRALVAAAHEHVCGHGGCNSSPNPIIPGCA